MEVDGEEDGRRERLRRLVREVAGPGVELSAEVEEALLLLVDGFVEHVASEGATRAARREQLGGGRGRKNGVGVSKPVVLSVADVRAPAEAVFGVHIPGFNHSSPAELRARYVEYCEGGAVQGAKHTARMQLVRSAAATAESTSVSAATNQGLNHMQ